MKLPFNPSLNNGHRFLVPEVVQTSAMDCGPASLKCLLEGFGIRVSYGRLREACQTDVDGTSIDTVEEVAVQLGLRAEQTMMPVDHVLLPEARALPAIIVLTLPSGATHFVVVWQSHGNLVQVMDPATGRRWPARESFLKEVYQHVFAVPAQAWRKWAGSDEFTGALQRRMLNLKVPGSDSRRLVAEALSDPEWWSVACLDAATRMVTSLASSGGVARGPEAARVLEAFFDKARSGQQTHSMIPSNFWSVLPADVEAEGQERLLLKGAVVVRVRGRRGADAGRAAGESDQEAEQPAPLSPELVAALEEKPSRPGRELLRLLRADGVLTPSALLSAAALAAAGTVFEALLFRGLFDIGRDLGLVMQRLEAMGALAVFVLALLLLELPLAQGMQRLGRRLESRLRVAFLEKLPRLGDRYFHSRLTSDMAERCHSLFAMRMLPGLGVQLARAVFGLAFTTAALIWLDPRSAPLALITAAVSIALPLVTQPFLIERDLRVRTHVGALSRFYLDAMLGLIPVRVHGAERAVRREHESLLVEWARSSLSLLRRAVAVEAVQALVGFGLAVWILLNYVGRSGEISNVLLLVYWGLSLPALGQQIALSAQQYPAFRNITLRLFEPLGAPEETGAGEGAGVVSSGGKPEAVCVAFEGVSVRAGGHTLLEGIDLSVKAGGHVAIVGPSGAGKSSLVGLLLGWHRPASGEVLIDGEPLDGERQERLRRETAWVDPTIQIWNRSLLSNVRYGTGVQSGLSMGEAIEMSRLSGVLKRLPDGLQTQLGEGGALVSGGEGQRVRLARAMLRPGVRLAILDEPFRGLDRDQRRELLLECRRIWEDATLFCKTHHIRETQNFERV
ncbi:MAG TPA: ATP-binding cassette domain-containing protein, partial [Blastocatellia bacterium]|nr:ATP-binding cassette domain-containing protein [Blastocatellia bacterium]